MLLCAPESRRSIGSGCVASFGSWQSPAPRTPGKRSRSSGPISSSFSWTISAGRTWAALAATRRPRQAALLGRGWVCHCLQAPGRRRFPLADRGRGPAERVSPRHRVSHAPGRHRLVQGPAQPTLPPASDGNGLSGLSGLSRWTAPSFAFPCIPSANKYGP